MADYTGDNDPNTFTGTSDPETIRGLGGDDVLDGAGGDDQIYGGTGRDELHGGDGDDKLYIETAGDFVSGEIYDGGTGIDTLISLASANFDLTSVTLTSIEKLQGSFILTSAVAAGVQDFNGTFSIIDAGPFLLAGKTGGGIFFLNVPGSVFDATGKLGTGGLNVTGTSGNDTIKGGAGTDTLTGGGGDDIIFGGGGNDLIIGGAGRDELHNGAFRITSASEVVAGEIYDGGSITLISTASSGTFDFSNSTLTNIGTFSAYPSGSAQIRITAAQADAIGAFHGAATFTLTTGGTVLLAGNDIQSTVSFKLSDQDTVFDGTGSTGTLLHITGGAGNDTITGAANLAIDIFGGGGNDILRGAFIMDGGTGADVMYGSATSNTYYVDQQDDVIVEAANGGSDLVYATGNYYLYDNLETLTQQGTADIFGVGNALDNTINGNSGANKLLGGLGADTINGNAGVDQLFGEDGNDILNGGADNDYLAGGIGNDVMDGGTGGDSLYGEDGNDTLTGGTDFVFDMLVGGNGNDALLGNSGLGDYDYLYGNAGDDSFYVDTGDDLTFEQAGEGTDTVYANVAGANNGVYLYANIENLVLLGTTAFGVGNELDNLLTGNAAGNTLLGGAGADTINGKAGNDILYGQAGADKFVFEFGTGVDNVGDFTIGSDKLDLVAIGYTYAQVQANTTVSNGNTAINLGFGDYVILVGVTAPLSQSDFILRSGSGSIHEPVAAQAVTISAPETSFTLDGADLHSTWAPINETPWFEMI